MLDNSLFIFSATGLGLLSAGTLVYLLITPRRGALHPLLDGGRSGFGSVQEVRKRLESDAGDDEFERLKRVTQRIDEGKRALTLEEKFFQAGFFSDESRQKFRFLRILSPIACAVLGLIAGLVLLPKVALITAIFGAAVGLQLPFSILDRIIARRNEEVMYYLPLVVEQLVIGISSSLDIGPCIQRVISMAEERDSHNVVTELLRHAQHYVKSGVSLEEALSEIGRLSGHTELKHVFMSLSQVSKHGGEISKQLQELADAVASQREARIEARIKTLELEATGPVGLVFLGFMGIFLIGIGMKVMEAFP